MRRLFLLDIHSHILPGVDDGSKSLDESVKILEMMKEQGITDVIATPHFYAFRENLDEYLKKIQDSYNLLKSYVAGMNLPDIFLGTEVLYYYNIGESESVYNFTFGNTMYLLLELTNSSINSDLFKDIRNLRDKKGIIPVIAHIERYHKSSNFRKLLKFIAKENIQAQVNASSLFDDDYTKITLKLIKKGYITYIATDSHSATGRVPMMNRALKFISNHLGNHYSGALIRNSEKMLDEITEASN